MTRLLDITVAALALIVCSPLLLLAAVAIALESRGGVIYRHQRIGRDGVPFELWKLRTMVSGAERMGAGLYIEPGDARITRVGALLRRFSLDELPNLVNVLGGQMSIVGPAAHGRGPGRPLHAPPAPAAGGQARDHRLGPGERAHVDLLARADRAGRLVRRPPQRAAGPEDHGPHGQAAGHRPGAVQLGARAGLG